MRKSPKRKSVMKHDFSRIPAANIPRSAFNRSHGLKTTFDSGLLIPFYLDEVVPGDTHSVRAHALARLATPIHPVMDNMFLETFFFFVPNRLVWSNWEKFMGEQDNPGDSTDFVIPTLPSEPTGYAENSIYDYFGIPTKVTSQFTHSVLPLRMYNLIWNEWFRDENLQDSALVRTGDSGDARSDYALLSRGKRHDYFTSCLPWPQKGPGVDLPLGTTAPIKTYDYDAGTGEVLSQNSSPGQTIGVNLAASTGGNRQDSSLAELTTSVVGAPDVTLAADLTDATASTINDLRQAFQIQKLQERDARGGTRYQELVLAHFGVRGGDARLNRPEFLGGGHTPISITQVPQTGFTATDVQTSDTPQGNLAGYGTANMSGDGFTKSFVEHGYIIGLCNVRADLTYQQGLERLWSRSTKYDFYWPALQALGEQSVLNKEIYTQGTPDDDLTFGYQERWAEMRYKNSIITGEFRSNAAQSLDPWHLSEDFGSLPVLGDTFITSKPPIDRVIAVTGEPQFIMDTYFQVKSVRPMPTYSVPGYIDHF